MNTQLLLFALTLWGLVPLVFAGVISARQNGPSDKDLLASCPGGPGSPNVEKADRCILKTPVAQPDQRLWYVLGDAQANCGGGTTPATLTVGGSKEVSKSIHVGADLGFNLGGLSIGVSASETTTTTTTASQSVSVEIPPGRQAVRAAGINYKVWSSNVQVNYGDRVFDHYEWYTRVVVTILVPDGNDITYDTHYSDCGTDWHDLNQPQ